MTDPGCTTIDGVFVLSDEAVEEEIRLALIASTDSLVDKFFLSRKSSFSLAFDFNIHQILVKAARSKAPQPSPAEISQITSTCPVVGFVE